MPVTWRSLSGLLCCLVALDAVGAYRHALLYEQHDALFVARCEARCARHKTVKHQQCLKNCLAMEISKAGRCPERSRLNVFEMACLNACTADSQCPGLRKCCHHNCGVTCQTPEGLMQELGLPKIPTDVSVSERRKGRTLEIKWRQPHSRQSKGPVLYVLEERHHVGPKLVEGLLGAWTPRHISASPLVLLKNAAKPGRWYQFRIAAVNENGTRGYSDPSIGFITSLGPRPPASPTNVSASPVWIMNGSVRSELRWEAPPSDLPVQRYKVFWSRRLHGATALNSVLVHHRTVSKDQTKFILKDLEPNSLYFLQVQGLAQFGWDRLKGEKAAIFLNTTVFPNATNELGPSSAPPRRSGRSEEDSNLKLSLRLLDFKHENDKLLARIAWEAPSKNKKIKYAVSWWTGPCHNQDVNDNLEQAITTKEIQTAIPVRSDCKIKVKVQEVRRNGDVSDEETIAFKTPLLATK